MAQTGDPKLPQVDIGILGGTGLYEIKGITDVRELRLETPFGPPSDAFFLGTLAGKRVAFLSRHGRGHRLLPSDINFLANIYGFKMLGVGRIIAVNSCGSLKEEIRPRDIVFSDQFFDWARRRSTFFGEGIAVHISFADPVCPELVGVLYETGKTLGMRVHKGGTYISIDGPAFSTRAESRAYRLWGCDVIGMTAATEAKLSREAEICYATMNLVTDYDVWHAEEEPVSVELILENLRLNIEHAKSIIKKAVAAIPTVRGEKCECGRGIENCIVTQRDLIPPETKKRLHHLIAKYIKE
jgi:5'-methylthioadenosine phosphorylase